MRGSCARSTVLTRTTVAPLELSASAADFSYTLRLNADRPLVLQGDGGFSKKSEREQASYYYSQPFFNVTGKLAIDDKPLDVTGLAWMDREWSSQPLASDQSGWDWFALHLDGGSKLMLYRMRQADGRHYASGKLISPEGRQTPLGNDAITMTPKATTEIAGRKIPTAWHVAIDSLNLDDRLRAAQSEKLDGHELRLLGRPDQLCRQPPRRRLSRADGILGLGLPAF